jgi:hypothetical protein
MSSPLVAIFLEQFKRAAAEGAVVELKLRMLCEAVRGLGEFAHKQRLEDVETAVIHRFKADLHGADEALLENCRKLRNKILHGDFRTAREKLREAGDTPRSGGVRFFTVDKSRDAGEQLSAALKAGPEHLPAVAATASTSQGKIFGWLLELGAAGDFALAAKTFQQAIAVIDRLAQLNADREVATARRADT